MNIDTWQFWTSRCAGLILAVFISIGAHYLIQRRKP